jgi:hypothetical protein
VFCRQTFHRKPFILLSAAAWGSILMLAWILTGALLTPLNSLAAQQSGDVEKKLKNRSVRWDPPALDSPVDALSSSPPCVLGKVLLQAGARANEMVSNLQNFTAQEKIEYQTTDIQNFVKNQGSESFDYVVVFQPSPSGLVIQEKRNPTHGSTLSPASAQDMGLPEIVLIFLPAMQDDYEMTCEGQAQWKSQPAWLVHFQQRRDRPSRTFSIRVGKDTYPVGLEGRAWISSDSGEIVHMETSTIDGVPASKIHHWYLSINYAPVQFQSQSVKIWLPQTVDGYCDYGDHRTIVYHTFTDFLLFSVQTDQRIEKPKQP